MDKLFAGEAEFARRSFLSFAGLGIGAAMMPSAAWALAAEDYPTIRSGIEGLVASKEYPNAYVAIGKGLMTPDILQTGNIALDSTIAPDMDTLWRIYSMTKPIVGIASMILVEEGKIKLDQPIADFLPEFADMKVLTDPDNSMVSVPAKTQITLRHLLTHTAGLGYSIISKGPIRKAYLDNGITPGAVSRFPIPGFEGGAPTPDIDTFSKRLGTLPLVAEPGTKWSYSVSIDLLGHLIGVVSGMEFGAFLKQRIFEPLKMNSSYFQVPEAETKRLVTNYGLLGKMMLPIDPGKNSIYTDKPAFPSGGGGLVSSTRDYDQFLKMILNDGELGGQRILSKETIDLATSNILPEGVKFDDGKAGFGAGGRVGLGASAGSFGWGGAAGTVAAVDRKNKMRMIGMTQVMGRQNTKLQQGLIEWVIQDMMAQMAKAA